MRMVEEASKRWDINSVSVVHRIGSLKPTDRIVFVGVASSIDWNLSEPRNIL